MRRSVRLALALGCVAGLQGCAGVKQWMPASGPNRHEVASVAEQATPVPVRVVQVDAAAAERVRATQRGSLFSETLGDAPGRGHLLAAGDAVEISIWEAPPATLFGSAFDTRTAALGGAQSRVTLPEQMVSDEGRIHVPFAGPVLAAGKSASELEEQITRQLKGKANQPQVMVRVVRNATANVTVVGEVVASQRMPLTPKGERLLDAVAAAGGVRQPIGKTTIQLTRGQQVQTLALDTVIRDPRQNIRLAPGDVVTALHQPLSFTVLGATGRNEEIAFEAQGISLIQALGRVGGVNDTRADAKGVFVFRFEDAAAVPGATSVTPDGKVPVVYRADLDDPATFFVAQGFPIRHKDVLYVSNAPAAELQKFLSLVSSAIYSVANIVRVVP